MADRFADVLAVEQHLAGRHLQLREVEKLDNAAGIGERDLGPGQRERDRPIHGAGVEELEAEPLCQSFGGGALARAGGSIDRDDHDRSALSVAVPRLVYGASGSRPPRLSRRAGWESRRPTVAPARAG